MYKLLRSLIINWELHLQLINDTEDCSNLRQKEKRKSHSRTEIINFIASQRKSLNYLEIGVRNPEDNFNQIQVGSKTSVDPGHEYVPNPVTHQMTSDEFFNFWKETKMHVFDLIFIDGLHLAEQVARDIESALAMSSSDGVICLHDCNPPNEYFAREKYRANNPAKGSWNGTTYKAVWKYAFEGEFQLKIVDCDWGVGVIDKSKPKSPEQNQNPYCEWDRFQKIRTDAGFLVSFSEFQEWIQLKHKTER